MNSGRIWTIFLRQFFLFKRGSYRIFALFYWPAMELFLWGVLTLYISRTGGERLSFISVLIGAAILWNFLIRIQQGITVSFLEDIWVRNFINLFSSPLTIAEYIIGLLVTSVLQMVISIGFMAFLAWLLFSYNIFQFGLWLVPFAAVLFLFGLALGILVTAIILRLGPSSEVLTWAIPAIISPLSGVFYPVDLLPRFIQPIAYVLPSTYIFEGMRNVVVRGIFDSTSLVYAAILVVIWITGAYLFLQHVYRISLLRGFFTRFMSE